MDRMDKKGKAEIRNKKEFTGFLKDIGFLDSQIAEVRRKFNVPTDGKPGLAIWNNGWMMYLSSRGIRNSISVFCVWKATNTWVDYCNIDDTHTIFGKNVGMERKDPKSRAMFIRALFQKLASLIGKPGFDTFVDKCKETKPIALQESIYPELFSSIETYGVQTNLAYPEFMRKVFPTMNPTFQVPIMSMDFTLKITNPSRSSRKSFASLMMSDGKPGVFFYQDNFLAISYSVSTIGYTTDFVRVFLLTPAGFVCVSEQCFGMDNTLVPLKGNAAEARAEVYRLCADRKLY